MPVQIGSNASTHQLWDRSPIVGIDLGTTHSLVAYVRDGKTEMIRDENGQSLLPSVVSWVGQKWIVGEEAKKLKASHPEQTLYSVKRLLGKSMAELSEDAIHIPYEMTDSPEGILVGILGRTLSPVQVSSMILSELRRRASKALGVAVTRAVITVPAYFNDGQRQATRAAARLAGWDVLRIINEPTAAALAYGLDLSKQGTIAVYDLGGGTFDISILKLKDGVFEVLATAGDTQLGGDDIDFCLAREFVRRHELHRVGLPSNARNELDPSSNHHSSPELERKAQFAIALEIAESAKRRLSVEEEAVLEWSGFSWKLSRQEFEQLVRPLLERTRGPCEQALRDSGVEKSQLSHVVLVGGPTRLVAVQEMVRDIFGTPPDASMHPDEVVAAGAAIQADILAGNNQSLLLLDVVPLSLGIETYGGLMTTLIPRNTRIPAVARETYTTFVDNQTGVEVHVLQGERERAADNRSLANFSLKGIAPQIAGRPRVEVSFLVDADGILQVSARDLNTGIETTVEVKPTNGLTDAQVEEMLSKGLENAEVDFAFKSLVQARTDAEPVLRAVEKRLADASRLLPQETLQTIQGELHGLRVAIEGDDPAPIRQRTHSLTQATNRLAELLVKEAVQKASKSS